jgi:hypothetical protein
VGGYVLQQQHVDAGGGERNKNKKVVESMRRICSLIALIFLIFFPSSGARGECCSYAHTQPIGHIGHPQAFNS